MENISGPYFPLNFIHLLVAGTLAISYSVGQFNHTDSQHHYFHNMDEDLLSAHFVVASANLLHSLPVGFNPLIKTAIIIL